MTLSYCSLSCCSSASRVRARCCRTENVPRIPQPTARVSEIARISRAAIDRSLNMGIPKLRETIPETPKKRFKKPLRKTEWKAASGRGAPESERVGDQAARRWSAQGHRHLDEAQSGGRRRAAARQRRSGGGAGRRVDEELRPPATAPMPMQNEPI